MYMTSYLEIHQSIRETSEYCTERQRTADRKHVNIDGRGVHGYVVASGMDVNGRVHVLPTQPSRQHDGP